MGKTIMIDLWNLFINLSVTSGILGFFAFLMRDTIGRYFSKAVEHRFEKKFETFKADIRNNETELEQIRSFLVLGQKDRDSAIQAKRLEAAEILLRGRQELSKLSMLVEYMKILNIEEILKDGENPKIIEFMNLLAKPMNIDESLKALQSFDKTLPQLYLNEKSMKAFDTYQIIILQAALMIKLFTLPLSNKSGLIKLDVLSKKIIEHIPSSKDAFEKWGEGYAYYWATFFFDEILRSLRHEISGADDMARDTAAVQRLAMDSRQAQANILSNLKIVGLPETLINPDEFATGDLKAAKKV
jgi:hypothetical protein